jgi:hypothetical protein
MNKILLLTTCVLLIVVACERHPVSQIPKEEGAKAEVEKSPQRAEPAPSGTPKTYFPK